MTERVRAGTLYPEHAHHLLDELMQQPENSPLYVHVLGGFLHILASTLDSSTCRDTHVLVVALFSTAFAEKKPGRGWCLSQPAPTAS